MAAPRAAKPNAGPGRSPGPAFVCALRTRRPSRISTNAPLPLRKKPGPIIQGPGGREGGWKGMPFRLREEGKSPAP